MVAFSCNMLPGPLSGETLTREHQFLAYLDLISSISSTHHPVASGKRRRIQGDDSLPRPSKIGRYIYQDHLPVPSESPSISNPVCQTIPQNEARYEAGELFPKQTVSQGCQTIPLPILRSQLTPTSTKIFPVSWGATAEPSPMSFSNSPKRRKSSIEDLCDNDIDEDDLGFLLGELGAFDSEVFDEDKDFVKKSDVDQHEGVVVIITDSRHRSIATNTKHIPFISQPQKQSRIRSWRLAAKQFRHSNN